MLLLPNVNKVVCIVCGWVAGGVWCCFCREGRLRATKNWFADVFFSFSLGTRVERFPSPIKRAMYFISFLFSEYNSGKVLLFHSRSVGEVNDNFLNKYEVNPCLDKYNMEHDLLMSHICVMVLKFKPIQGLMRRRQ